MTENYNPANNRAVATDKLKAAMTKWNANIEGVDLDVDNASAAITALQLAAPNDVTHAELTTLLNPYLTSAAGVDTTELAAELAGYVTDSDLLAAVAGKQDAATAATDQELLAATTDEVVQDKVSALLAHAGHTNVTAAYDDAANRIVLSASGGAARQTFTFAFSGSASVGAVTERLRLLRAGTITGVAIGADGAPAGTAPNDKVELDLKKNGATVYTTTANRPKLASGSTWNGAVAQPNNAAFVAGDYYTVNVLTAGDTAPGTNVVLYLEVEYA